MPDGQTLAAVAGQHESAALAESGFAAPAKSNAPERQGESTAHVISGEDGIIAEHEAGVVLAKIPEGVSLDAFNAGLAQIGYLASQTVSEGDLSLGWAELKLARGVNVPEALTALEASGVVSAAQPNFVYRLVEADDGKALKPGTINGDFPPKTVPTGVVYDTGNYHDFVNDSQSGNQMVILAVKLAEACRYLQDKGYISATGVATSSDEVLTWNKPENAKRPVVAVLDTGCDLDHEDLRANIVDHYDAVRPDSWRGDIDGHGTHVSGIAAAVTNNGKGITGVSLNAGLLPVNVFDFANGDLGADSKDIAAGYEYVMEHASEYNVRVVNLSLGSSTETADADDKLLLAAIEKAYRSGILTVIASGNDAVIKGGAYTDYPADFSPNAISVIDCCVSKVIEVEGTPASEWIRMSRDGYSNYNKAGTLAKQVSALGSFVKSTIPGNGYGDKNGTSMASPCVAGMAALAWQVNPDLTVEQVKSLLYSTTDDVTAKVNGYDDEVEPGFDVYTGFGTVDAYRLVKAADTGMYLGVADGGQTDIPVLGKGLEDASTVKLAAPEREGAAWAWASSAPAVASVNSTGLVTATGAGQAIISASLGEGDDAVVLCTTVTVRDAEIIGVDSVTCGSTAELQVDETTPADGALLTSGTWQWSSSDDAVATVGEWSGVVTGKAAGNAIMTATLVSNPGIALSKVITVSDPPVKPTTADGSSSAPASSSGSTPKPNPDSPAPDKPAPDDPAPVNPAPDSPDQPAITPSIPIPSEPKPILAPSPAPEVTDVQVMYRLYNEWTGEHFYTADAEESDGLVEIGWSYEGVGWMAPTSGDAVYRLYNPYVGDHHYTLDAAERDGLVDAGWVDEGLGWYSDSAKTVPLYREYNPNMFSCNHNYTSDPDEHAYLVSLGWADEGIAWYGAQ